MSIRTSRWPAGVPCWADLSVPDVGAARTFYAEVLGWTFQESGEEYGGYVIGERRGAAAAGIGPQQQQAGPAAWTLYVASDDADKSAAAVTDLGGTVVMAPGDVGPMGRMFIASDPTGAVFGVWQANTMIGAEIVNEPGGITWEDLRSPDPDAARRFYSGVFGYHTQPIPDAGPDYTTFSLAEGEPPIGGIGGMFGAVDAPPHWLVYFGVAEVPVAVAAAERARGSVTMKDTETPYGRMAGLTDPDGAHFWIVETPAAPDSV